MFCVSVVYPHKEGANFDFDYYLNTHIPMAAEPLGDCLVRSEVIKGLPGPDGTPPAYVCIGNIWLNSLEQFQASMAQNGEAIAADIPKFTNIQPIFNISEVLDSTVKG